MITFPYSSSNANDYLLIYDFLSIIRSKDEVHALGYFKRGAGCLVGLSLCDDNNTFQRCFLGVTKVMYLLLDDYECDINLYCAL